MCPVDWSQKTVVWCRILLGKWFNLERPYPAVKTTAFLPISGLFDFHSIIRFCIRFSFVRCQFFGVERSNRSPYSIHLIRLGIGAISVSSSFLVSRWDVPDDRRCRRNRRFRCRVEMCCWQNHRLFRSRKFFDFRIFGVDYRPQSIHFGRLVVHVPNLGVHVSNLVFHVSGIDLQVPSLDVQVPDLM